MELKKDRVRISFAAHLKPVPVAGFIISGKNSVTTVSRVAHYRKPRLVRSKYGWYIVYHYRIPVMVREFYDGKEWLMFRIKEDMNRRKGPEREEYAAWLLEQIELSLKNGYNPFDPEMKEILGADQDLEEKRDISIRDGLLLFLEKWRTRGLDKTSIAKYERYVSRLIEWLIEKHIPEKAIGEITSNHIEKFLLDNKKKHDLSNREYNNTLLFIRTAFNFMVKKKYITESPAADIDKQQANTVKHRYYDAAALKTITTGLQMMDPYTLFAFQVVYHLCIRAEKELQHFKIGNILWDQDKVFIDVGKGSSQRYIPMDQNIKQIFLDRKLDQYPAHYHVFGPWGEPAEKPFASTFFSRKFMKVRNKLGMDPVFSLYGAKHTRIIHLKNDGATDSDIMSLTGHRDFTAYAKYLRDLGLGADAKKLNLLSRKLE